MIYVDNVEPSYGSRYSDWNMNWTIQVLNRGRSKSVFRHFRKIAKRDYWLHVCPSVRMEHLGSHWTDFHEILYLSIFRESVEKIQVSLKPYKK